MMDKIEGDIRNAIPPDVEWLLSMDGEDTYVLRMWKNSVTGMPNDLSLRFSNIDVSKNWHQLRHRVITYAEHLRWAHRQEEMYAARRDIHRRWRWSRVVLWLLIFSVAWVAFFVMISLWLMGGVP